MKKLLILILAICLGFMIGLPPASTTEDFLLQDEAEELVWHDISEMDTLPYDETYSYDELVQKLISAGYSYDETMQIAGEEVSDSAKATTRYALFSMKQFKYKKDYYAPFVLQARFNVGLQYSSGSDTPNKIVSLEAAPIYTGGGSACEFNGNIFYKLTSGNSFYYNFYGDIYKKGTTNWSIGATIGIGGSATLTASISNDDGYITNVSESETYYSSAMAS